MSARASGGGQPTPGPTPSTSKQEAADEKEMEMSLPTVDPTKLIYDKGHIMEWLSFSVASVQSVLSTNDKNISAYSEKLVDANIPTLIQEDFRSCRTTQNIVLGVADQIDVTIRQLLREKNNMLSALNIYYPAIETVKPATVTLMTRDVQTDLTMIGDHKAKTATAGVQTSGVTKLHVSCGTEGLVGHASSSQDQSTSMEGYEEALPAIATPSVHQDLAEVVEVMEVSEDGAPGAGTEPEPEELDAVAATSSSVQDVENTVTEPVLEPIKAAEVEAVNEAVDVPTDVPSSPNLSDDDNLRQGENYEMIIPKACEVTLDKIPEDVFDYIRIHGSIRIQNSVNPEGNHEDRELEDALRSLKNFDADVSRRQEKQRNRSGIRKQKSTEQLKSNYSQDIDVRDVDPADQDAPILDWGHMEVDDAGVAHDRESTLDRGAIGSNSAEFCLDDGFKLSDESAAMNSLFGNQIHPEAKSDAPELHKDHASDPLLANNTTSPDTEANMDANHPQTDKSPTEGEDLRKPNRAYVPSDCFATNNCSGVIDVESDKSSDDIVLIDLTQDEISIPSYRKKRRKRIRTISDESDGNSSKRLCEDVDPSSPDVLLEWDASFSEVPLIGDAEIEPDVQPVVDLTTSSQVDNEVERVKTELIKPQIKKEPGTRRNIRPILQEDALSLDTRKAEEEEKAKLQRIERHQEQISTVVTSGALVLDQYGEEQLKVHNMLYDKLKAHQKDGVRFMWNGCFETVETYLTTRHEGAGCILAHCMGLGKTLTAITFMQTILTFSPLGISRVLVLCPSGIVENWDAELKKWLGPINRPRVPFYNFQTQKGGKMDRTKAVQQWAADGGIGVMSYTSFMLCFSKTKRGGEILLEGAEQHLLEACVLICDEGHTLKNHNTQTFKAVQRIKTKRRIILTGTPMQNNLTEYYWMVSFVRPQLLGTLEEFNNQFGNPILNGQMMDSTTQDVTVMRRRSSILFEKLKGTCHREGVDVLKCLIPPKHEFTIFVKLSEIQLKLYDACPRSEEVHGSIQRVMTVCSLLSKILCHPKALLMGKTEPAESHDRELMNALTEILKIRSTKELQSDQKESSTSSGETGTPEPTSHVVQQGAANIPSSAPEELQSIPLQWYPNAAEMGSEEHQSAANLLHNENINITTEMFKEPQATTASPWWSQCLKDVDVELLDHSYKMVILLQLIKNCVKKKEKVLVFSQYVYSLNLIEKFLDKVMPEMLGGPKKWEKGEDWFRMDGNTKKLERERSNTKFNRSKRAKVYLVTSKTGGHGINLVGASRLILFDSSFNPSSDLQCIYRIYRLGQEKTTVIYRLIGGLQTAEHTAYLRQKVKLGISERVVDDHGTHRSVTKDAYMNSITGKLKQPQSVEEALVLNYDDEVLNKVIDSHADLLNRIENGDMEHVEDKLSEDEIANAVREFEQEIKDQQAAAAAKETANTPRKGGKKNKKQGPNLPKPPPSPEKDCVQNSSTQG